MPINVRPSQLIVPMPEDLYPEVTEIINDTICRAIEDPIVEGTTITNSLDTDSQE